MKRSIFGILVSLIIMSALLINIASQIQVYATSKSTQRNLQEDLTKQKYPFSEQSDGKRMQLATDEINILKEQIANFRPGQGISLSYIENTILHLRGLLTASINRSLKVVNISHIGIINAPIPINMIYYGSNSGGIDQKIISAHPEYLVDNSAVGPQKGDANISEYTSAGIKYFEYLDGGYEGTVSRSIPNDLQSNLNYIKATAIAGAYGIFLDEVSANPDIASLTYLQQIYNEAHSLGIKVVFNTGVSSWSDSLMNYCDYMNSSEIWQNNTLTKSQKKYGNRVWLETQGVTNANTAANLTETAWDNGISAEYACNEYITLPDWLDSYFSKIKSYVTPDFSFTIYVAVCIGLVVLVTAIFVWRKRLGRR